jgi:predicted Rossmann-fold nucleotide-binding protein
MKMDHPPLMKEPTPSHTIHPKHMEKTYGGDGHKQHHEYYKAHAAGHKLHHEHVEAMCGGGKTK